MGFETNETIVVCSKMELTILYIIFPYGIWNNVIALPTASFSKYNISLWDLKWNNSGMSGMFQNGTNHTVYNISLWDLKLIVDIDEKKRFGI